MFLNIITPCSRPHLLPIVAKSINIPKQNYRWIIVFDGTSIPQIEDLDANYELYNTHNPESVAGHAQRNYALDLVTRGHVYFNDDDTVVHKDLWENIKDLTNDFIHFNQEEKDGTIRLNRAIPILSYVDSHNFITSNDLIEHSRFVINRRDADGVFAENMHRSSKNSKYIPKVLSTYNALR
jgi:hypothetical protein